MVKGGRTFGPLINGPLTNRTTKKDLGTNGPQNFKNSLKNKWGKKEPASIVKNWTF